MVEKGSLTPPPDESGGSANDIVEALGRITAENARLLQRLTEGEKRFRLISRGVVRVQEAERGRISRELHDGVGQSLTALKLQLELLERRAESEGSVLAAPLGDLRELADRSLQDVRQLSHLIRPPMLDDLGLLPTLRWLARTFQQRTGIEMVLAHEGIDDGLDPDLATLVFRVVQESLNNIAKHSGSQRAEVDIHRDGDRLQLRVRDHGQGFSLDETLSPSEEPGGFGLRGMRDRVQLFGGRFSLISAPGEGTTVEVEVPLAT